MNSIMCVMESGIYEFLYKVAQNPTRIGPNPDEQTLQFAQNVDPLRLNNFKPTFILFISFESSMLIILLMEFHTHLVINYFS